MRGLTVVIPTLNEARSLPLLLADLALWPWDMQLLVVDGSSRDATVAIADLAGAEVLISPQRGRGQQLLLGTGKAREDWLLVLHADSRLHPQWPGSVSAVMSDPSKANQAWTFDFQVEGHRPMLRVLERAVALRSRWLQRPYGDQGLLIHRGLLDQVGGYRALPLMEDLDLVVRLSAKASIERLGLPLTTSGRRWSHAGVLRVAWRNARLRARWRRGEDPVQLAHAYAADSINSRTRRHSGAAAVPAPNPGADKSSRPPDPRRG